MSGAWDAADSDDSDDSDDVEDVPKPADDDSDDSDDSSSSDGNAFPIFAQLPTYDSLRQEGEGREAIPVAGGARRDDADDQQFGRLPRQECHPAALARAGGAPSKEEKAQLAEMDGLPAFPDEDGNVRGRRGGKRRRGAGGNLLLTGPGGGAKKRSLSGYTLFVREQSVRIQAERRESGLLGNKQERGGLMRECGPIWKALDASERDAYNKRAKAMSDGDEEGTSSALVPATPAAAAGGGGGGGRRRVVARRRRRRRDGVT